jgi:hypothetical protein
MRMAAAGEAKEDTLAPRLVRAFRAVAVAVAVARFRETKESRCPGSKPDL